LSVRHKVRSINGLLNGRVILMSRLEGKIALVTGGAGGIVEAIARAMAAEGAKVVMCDVLDRAGEALAKEFCASAKYVELDATRPHDGCTSRATR
jgi:3alpha(or 20beta)-hydroxysteroid dehydrogenase